MTSRHNDAWDSPGFLLWHASLRWQRVMVEALAPFDLTHVQFVLLASTWWLAEHDGPPRQRDLADHLVCDRSYVTSLADQLEDRGLVERVPGTDRRVKLLQLTDTGTQTRDRISDAVARHALVLRRLTPAQRTTLRPILEALLHDD